MGGCAGYTAYRYFFTLCLAHWLDSMERGRPSVSPALWRYLVAVGVFCVVSSLGAFGRLAGAVRAARGLHRRMMEAVIRAPCGWFDATPVGRIQNRFAADFQKTDRNLSSSLGSFVTSVPLPGVALYACAGHQPLELLYLLPVVAIVLRVATVYMRAARDIKRLGSIAKSPVFALFNEGLIGATTLRAFHGALHRHALRFQRAVDELNRAEMHQFAANYWMATRVSTLGALVSGATAAGLLAAAGGSAAGGLGGGGGVSAATAGLMLAYANDVRWI